MLRLVWTASNVSIFSSSELIFTKYLLMSFEVLTKVALELSAFSKLGGALKFTTQILLYFGIGSQQMLVTANFAPRQNQLVIIRGTLI
jgi:hypothetical protein